MDKVKVIGILLGVLLTRDAMQMAAGWWLQLNAGAFALWSPGPCDEYYSSRKGCNGSQRKTMLEG